MLWFYLTLFSILGISIANIFRRIAMKNDANDAVASTVVFQFIGAIIIGFFAAWHGFILPPITKYPLNFILQAVLWGSASMFLFKASSYLEASESAIITTLNSVVTIIAAIFLLHEGFSLVFTLGTALIILSIGYLFYDHNKMKLNKGVWYAFGYCLLAGFGYTNDAFMLKFSHSDPLSLLTLGFLLPGIFLLFIKPKAIFKIMPLVKSSHMSKVVLLTFFYALASIAYFFAIATGGQVSRISPISQSAIILTVLLGAVFLGEKDHLYKKIFCTILVTTGVILLS